MREVNYSGIISIILSVGLVLALLCILGYKANVTYEDKERKIEVHAVNSNSNELDKD